jgi:hypothetical protein
MEESAWPLLIRESAAARKYIELLGSLDWEHFPERSLGANRRGPKPAPDAPVVAFLVKLDKGLESMPDRWEHLVEQPALTWALGFPLAPSGQYSYGFDVAASLPTHRHLSRLLRTLPNAQMQFLLTGTVHLLQAELPTAPAGNPTLGEEVSLDTKHFTLAGGFAAVPWADRADHKKSFSPERLPLCDAGLAMPLKGKVQKKSHCLVPPRDWALCLPVAFPGENWRALPH